MDLFHNKLELFYKSMLCLMIRLNCYFFVKTIGIMGIEEVITGFKQLRPE